MLRSSLIVAGVLGLGACASLRRGDPECNPAPFLEIRPRAIELAPGETLRLRPARRISSVSSLPERCTAEWAVRGKGISVDQSGLLTATTGVPVGTRFTVRAERNGLSVARPGMIVDPAPNPLAGAWRQRQSPGCGNLNGLVGELIFQRGGEYLLTERPFEGQIGEIGTYEHDRQTARLVLRRGDQVRGEGTARVEAGRLVIDGRFSFTAAMPMQTCTAVFDAMSMPNV
jgi:hypothetical protein